MSSDRITWHAIWTIEKFDDDGRFLERLVVDGNLAVTAGLQVLIDLLIASGSPTAFSAANARIGVGDSSAAVTVGQTDLQAATNKLRKGMEATFPSRSGVTLSLKAAFGTGEANFAWNEIAVFNAASGGAMLNRKVESMGTKSSGTWTAQVDIAFA